MPWSGPMERNPCIDLLTHLHPSSSHPVDLETVARAAAAHGVAVELNHSKLLLGKADPEPLRLLVRTCKAAGCRMAVCSDAHVLNELGRDEHALPLLAQEDFPAALWVNETAEKAFAFVASRRSRKRPEDGHKT